jgi:RHH-type proline utilization regulon transcriptional repressor/proline dehydrogenase/delta 1-pyrroline-5-carboxylate dehydrogenase
MTAIDTPAEAPARTTVSPDELDDLAETSVALASALLGRSLDAQSRPERRRRRRLGAVLRDDAARTLVQALTDDVLRIDDPHRAARRFADLVEAAGTPTALGRVDGALLRVGARLAPVLPRLVMPLVLRRIRSESRGIILPIEDPAFAEHAARRSADGARLNVNVLGEAILSDEEADARLATVRSEIARPDVDYVSVKISALCANLDVWAFDHSVERIAERLRLLYADAQLASPPVFVNLDMEEYRDLELTLAAFRRVLDEAAFRTVDAGIVLQAYLPDSHDALERLGTWATARRVDGGGRVKVRIVKGANLAMETLDADLHGWNQAPYATKAEVDASFKRLLLSALRPEWADAVRVGVASHNLFDIAFALVLRDHLGAQDRIDLEMLEGMAPSEARVAADLAGGIVMYTPVVARDDVDSSIAYLARRLDENTAPENFLCAMFDIEPGSPAWYDQERRFRTAVRDVPTLDVTSRRSVPRPGEDRVFVNEPELDLTQPSVRAEVAAAMVSPAVRGWDEPGCVEADSVAEIDAAVGRARAAATPWSQRSIDDRASVLERVPGVMRDRRSQTLAVMAAEAGKTVREADPEVSEAIDFVRYAATAGSDTLRQAVTAGLDVRGGGVVVVASPWNFPYAIPCGGVVSALMAGHAVLMKPAPETRRIARELAQQMWDAGVPYDLLQIVRCEDGPVGRHLVSHADVHAVLLTGAHETARLFQQWRPTMRVMAETSGKNAIVVTAAADLDGAIRDVVRSAFGHAGQKCSAASLVILEASLHDDPTVLRRLVAATRSLVVGPADAPATVVGPLVAPPQGNLARALTTLEPGERWALEPRSLDDTGRLWSPGIRTGVQPGSWFHVTECFGPVLGVMRARDLDHAIEIQNATPCGLTGGIHSLDPVEVRHWVERVEVGNAYVNRHITGAVVQRQPFGGWKRSSVGAGQKAGGPDAVTALATITDPSLSTERARRSLTDAWRSWFGVEHDPTGIAGERNVLRYRPLGSVWVVGASPTEWSVALDAARHAGVGVEQVSADDAVRRLVAGARPDRVRAVGVIEESLLRACHRADVDVDPAPIVSFGRVELLHWVREQAISEANHRYGRVVAPLSANQAASASPIGVLGGPSTKGHSSSAIRR